MSHPDFFLQIAVPKVWKSSVFLWIVTNPSGWKPLEKTVYYALSRFRTKIIVINLKGESLKQKIKGLMK